MITLTPKDLAKIKDFLLDLGIAAKDVVCVFMEGSCLYVKEPRDIDLLVLTKTAPFLHKAPVGHDLAIRGLPVDVNIFSVEQFYHMEDTFPHQFYHEEKDYVTIMGDSSGIKLHELTPENMGHEARSFEDVLFKPDYEDYRPKRLVTFFVLARQFGIDISDELIEKAHREELDPKDYRWIFDTLFTKTTPNLHHAKTKTPI